MIKIISKNTRTFAFSNCDLKFTQEEIWFADLCLDQSATYGVWFDQIYLNLL